MRFIELVELLSEWWFPLSTRVPAELINRRLGYTVRGAIEAGGQMKCPRTVGLGYTNKNSAVSRVAPFFLAENSLKDF